MMREYEIIEEYLIAVQEEFPRLDVKYEWDEVDEVYIISFNTADFEYESGEVKLTMSNMAQEMLDGEDFSNYEFGVDCL